ncbi:MAG: hypothetical protein RL174_295, partial [Actinomycetota bacterium]
MAIWGKNSEEETGDVFAPRPAVGQPDGEKTHTLAEIAIDAGSVDVTPSTSSIEIITEAPSVEKYADQLEQDS